MFRMKLDMTQSELDAIYNEQIEEMDRKTLEAFKRVLTRALEIQRSKIRPEGYNDQTGQLRSSTGGIIYRDGKVLHEDFELSPYGTDKAPGLKEGREKAFAELRESSGWGITLVAGMEYASWVETNHGLTVVSEARKEVDKSLDQAFNEIDV
ncbi:hypothetical protein [Sphingobacterium sp. UBA5789]|uniref:hypothetical protein n=2 Tax=unclassified Sphingobacterium TaxID=2609468 RepID=UPI0025EDDBE6|nr:hypothetical protein [Sphingobacterium sp. UBA5789]